MSELKSRSEVKRLAAGAPEKLEKAYLQLKAKYEELLKKSERKRKRKEEDSE